MATSIVSKEREGGLLGGTLLVAGTSIGAGMLALPVLTSAGGFLPSIVLYFLSWIVMTFTGLLFLELCLWMGKEANIVSIAERLLGSAGKVIAWVIYIYLFTSFTVAYLSGSGQIISSLFGRALPEWTAVCLFVLLFSPLVFVGARAVDKVNIVLVAGLAVAYVSFIVLGLPHIKGVFLTRVDWSASFISLPVILGSFGFQGIIPSLTSYMGRRATKIRLAIILGTTIPFLAYTLWELVILGIVPLSGSNGLAVALREGSTAVAPLKHFLAAPWIYVAGEFFAFFALTSSFLGVTLSFRDFLADGLRVQKNARGRFILCLMIFAPTTCITLINPRLFLLALHYGGGIGSVLLLGLLPLLLVFALRYRQRVEPGRYEVGGGKPALVVAALFFIGALAAEAF